MIKVSIIIPIYNVEKYVVACLRSVALQSMSDEVEVILVDDCGNDSTMPIVESFLTGEYTQINPIIASNTFILHHTHNRGLSAARNTGIDVAKGKYVFFLDSDDELTSDCLKKMFALAEKYEADMVQGCYISDQPMLSSFCKSMPEYSEDKGYIKRTILDYDHFPIMAQNRLVRRDLILNNKLYFKEGIIHEDNHWTFFLSKHINRLAVCDTPTYLYRTTPGSISSTKNVEKEANAFKTLITDFCNSIDPIEEGSQKRLIFYNILTIRNGGYYRDSADLVSLKALFELKLLLSEKILFRLCFSLKENNILFPKTVNLLARIMLCSKMDLISRIDNKLYIDLNYCFRKKILIPHLRNRVKNKEVSIIASNCIGGCISHNLGLRFNSPFVNVWLYPKDFIRYCKNIKHYMNCNLVFLSSDQVRSEYSISPNYPVGRLDDVTIFFQHYHSEEEAKRKWVERTKRINLDNLRLILTERDGCTKEDIVSLSRLPYKTACLVHKPMNDICIAHYIKGFEKVGFVDNSMIFKKFHYFGKMYYDDFDYVSFINEG